MSLLCCFEPATAEAAVASRDPCWATNQERSRRPGVFSEAVEAGRFGIVVNMSPTVSRDCPFRFFFFSREERRMHVHVQSADGEAKFWIEPRSSWLATISSAPRT